MIDFVRGVGEFGAAIVALALNVGMLAGAVWLTYLTQRLFTSWPTIIHRTTVALAFLVYVAVLAVLVWPSHEAVTKVACRSASDFMACVEGDE